MLEYRVLVCPKGKKVRRFLAAFELRHWQFAEKLAALVREKGHHAVVVLREVKGR